MKNPNSNFLWVLNWTKKLKIWYKFPQSSSHSKVMLLTNLNTYRDVLSRKSSWLSFGYRIESTSYSNSNFPRFSELIYDWVRSLTFSLLLSALVFNLIRFYWERYSISKLSDSFLNFLVQTLFIYIITLFLLFIILLERDYILLCLIIILLSFLLQILRFISIAN